MDQSINRSINQSFENMHTRKTFSHIRLPGRYKLQIWAKKPQCWAGNPTPPNWGVPRCELRHGDPLSIEGDSASPRHDPSRRKVWRRSGKCWDQWIPGGEWCRFLPMLDSEGRKKPTKMKKVIVVINQMWTKINVWLTAEFVIASLVK